MVKLKCLGQKNTEMGLYSHKEIKQLQEDFELVVNGLEEIYKSRGELDKLNCKITRIPETLSKLKGPQNAKSK